MKFVWKIKSRDAYCPTVKSAGIIIPVINWNNTKKRIIINQIRQYPLIDMVKSNYFLKFKKKLSWKYITF